MGLNCFDLFGNHSIHFSQGPWNVCAPICTMFCKIVSVHVSISLIVWFCQSNFTRANCGDEGSGVLPLRGTKSFFELTIISSQISETKTWTTTNHIKKPILRNKKPIKPNNKSCWQTFKWTPNKNQQMGNMPSDVIQHGGNWLGNKQM